MGFAAAAQDSEEEKGEAEIKNPPKRVLLVKKILPIL